MLAFFSFCFALYLLLQFIIEEMAKAIESQLKSLPSKYGIYIFKDTHGKVLYVGKAANLRHRVKSYFSSGTKLSPKLQKLIVNISDLEFMVTDSEQEALILECNLIKKYHPPYNIRLKDDKTFPYLKIDLSNDWPGLYFTRRLKKDGSKYFGPFANAGSVRRSIKLIKKIFPFRSCNKIITGTDTRPCLNYHINRCLGPCIGAVSKKDYDEVIQQVILFLEGKQELIVQELKGKMAKASEQLQFEKAALLRDQIKSIENVIEGQQIAIAVSGDMDVIALAQDNDRAYVEIFFIRNNKLIGQDNLIVDGIQDEKPEHIITNFVKQYYTPASSVPPRILLQHPLDEPTTVSNWLKSLRGAPVKLLVPHRGAKKQLVDIVTENAREGLELYQIKQPSTLEYNAILNELKERLKLPSVPLRIEGYDISNIRGNLSVGSMVVFDKGIPKPAHYRRFKIMTVLHIDDYSMIQEVLRRRFHRYLDKEDKWAIMPDLVLIDGGKGHLNAASEVIRELGLDTIPLASIAKENEEVFILSQSAPIDIPKASGALHLLQRVRDESHRFALSYHQRLRSKKTIISVLDSIPGIGPKRKKALLKQFDSVKGIKDAAIEELTMVNGITNKLAEIIKEHL